MVNLMGNPAAALSLPGKEDESPAKGEKAKAGNF